MVLKIHNSLSGKKEELTPLDRKNVRMYVCGPTVYDSPHLGNARAVVVYDVLYRLLRHIYGEEHVTYVRNITDVDDKINAAAKEKGIPISELTEEVTKGFHEDMEALNCLPPTHEPKATENIKEIIELIEKLIKNKHAYESEGHVLFDVQSISCHPERSEGSIDSSPMAQNDNFYYYGKLSGKKLEDLIAGARVEVEGYKKSPQDFVLWKPADEGDDSSSVFESPWGAGRPGWHIECSAMSTSILGEDFDIHGGGADLKFPHHENEIAQSICGNKGSHFANYWVHNGFLTVNGEKMAKSEGNFITVRELLDKGIKGEIIRYVLLSTKYNEPLDWSEKKLDDARKALDKFYRAIKNSISDNLPEEFISYLKDDLNTPKAFAYLYSEKNSKKLKAAANFLGLLQNSQNEWFGIEENKEVEKLIADRKKAKEEKDYKKADKIRDKLTNMGIILEDGHSGTTWRKK